MSNNSINANIIGTTFVSTPEGKDPEYDVVGLTPNALYFRIDDNNGGFNYIYANEISRSIKSVDAAVSNKASISDLTELESNISENKNLFNDRLNNIQIQLNNKAEKSDCDAFVGEDYALKSDLQHLQSIVSNKMDVTALEDFKYEVTAAVSGEDSIVGSLEVLANHNKKSIDEIQKDIEALRKVSDDLSDTGVIDAIQLQIAALETQLSNKIAENISDIADIESSIDNVNTRVSVLTGQVSNVNNAINRTASKVYVETEINRIDDTIDSINAELNTKASAAQLTKKASKAELDNVAEKINNINNTVGNRLNTLEIEQKKLSNNLSTKANQDYVDDELSVIERDLTTKANIIDVNKNISSIEKRLTTLELSNEDSSEDLDKRVDTVESGLNSLSTQFKSVNNNYTDKFNDYDKQFKSLNNTDRDIKQQLKNEWIRVMTPAEYQNLPTNPNYSDGSRNPYALQPNTIYFLVKYNKPYALYIGSTLIAKVEEKNGNAGFVYSFPIVFK
jgi:hypothetical protein